MKWKAVADGGGFPDRDGGERLVYWRESRDGPLSPDGAAEQQKLLWADALTRRKTDGWLDLALVRAAAGMVKAGA